MTAIKPQIHPSGRPVRNNESKKANYYNVPRDDYLCPRLQNRGMTRAVGFMHSWPDGGGE